MEEEEEFNEGTTEIDEETSDENVANDNKNVNDNNDTNLVPMSITLEDVNRMQVNHLKEQLTTRSISVPGNKATLMLMLTKVSNDYAESMHVSKVITPFPAPKKEK